jgi:hypothetical protein
MTTPNTPASATWRAVDGLAFFETVCEGFERAVQSVGGTSDYDYLLGGCSIRLRFASPALASKITPALAHRTAPPASPALTVYLWDSNSTRTEPPLRMNNLVSSLRSRWSGTLRTRRELEGYCDQRFRSAFHLGPDILSVLDTERNLAVYWVQDAARLPYYEQGAPLQTILSWWMSEHARLYIHAGAVGTAEGGVLLAGKGGSGKSTTALACLGTPLRYASDDYALVTLQPKPYVHSLYNTAKMKGREDLERFPHLASHAHNLERLGEEKLMVFLQAHYAKELIAGFPIKGVMVPRVTGKLETTVQPMTPGAALTALAPSTLFQLSGSPQNALRSMAALVRQVPCYELALGTDIKPIAQVLMSVMSRE